MTHIGRYRVTHLLGEGGMGVVYAAHDDRLDRPVAIKLIRPEIVGDAVALERFRREARAAARVSHPHVCLLYEFDEVDDQPFLVMELLDGEPLAERLRRGPMPVDEALAIAEPMLAALAALHRRGVLHRDLKPANVFLTSHGVKLLDFGLARPTAGDDRTHDRLTSTGVLLGTPQYMAPEQLFDGQVDERADIFAAAAIIYEMLAGRPAFGGRTLAATLHAIGYEDCPPLSGSDAIIRVDRVVRAAMTKAPADRIARADIFAGLLRDARQPTGVAIAARPVTTTRFVALPLRVLRPDPDTDFLAFSVPDAVSVALAGLESVIVRSPQGVAATGADVRQLGRDLSVDVVLSGTILRAGEHVRVNAQLADAHQGTLVWSDVAQAPITDLFQLQDTLTAHIVASLALPLSARDRRSLDHQAPSSAEAYELYLRANELSTHPTRWPEARDLYEQSVTRDPTYAPAWARLGRARRMLAKWGGPAGIGLMPQAEAAFRRALELDPDLSIAHDLSAYVDAELGRAEHAVVRLVTYAARRRPTPGIYAGLVTSCRYAGLLDASLAAHDRAVAADPAQRTSVAWTHFLRGDYERAIATETGTLPYCALLSQQLLGRLPPGVLERLEAEAPAPGTRLGIASYRAAFSGNVPEAVATLEALRAGGFADPEGWYIYGMSLARIGAVDHAVRLLTMAVDGGYGCHEPLVHRDEWAPCRQTDEFAALVERTAAMAARARAALEAAGGAAVLPAARN